MGDTSQQGGMYKDQLYLIGAHEVLKNRKNIDFMELYAGKLNLIDAKRLAKKKLIDRQSIRLPYFMENMEKYKLTLDTIAETNFIN